MDESRDERWRMVLGAGETVELDGSLIQLDESEPPSSAVLLRLVPWRARSLSYALGEWSVIAKMFAADSRREVGETELSRMLVVAASAAEGVEVELRDPRGRRTIHSAQRLAALAVLAEGEPGLALMGRLALVDAAAWWMSDENGGSDLAHALLTATCTRPTVAERAYLALIEPPKHQS